MILRHLVFCATALTITVLAGPAAARDCSEWPRFSSSQAYLQPLSVPASEIGDHLTASKWSDGIQVTSQRQGKDIWLDITHFPGTTTAAAGPRIIMMAGRLADESFSNLVLSDHGNGIFLISEPDIRSIGCRFIWGVEGGENPIALLREMYAKMVWFETHQPLSTRWNGSLLGDTMTATSINNDIVIPKWVMSAVK